MCSFRLHVTLQSVMTLELRNVSKSYDGGRTSAVEDVSFLAAPGDLVVA